LIPETLHLQHISNCIITLGQNKSTGYILDNSLDEELTVGQPCVVKRTHKSIADDIMAIVQNSVYFIQDTPYIS